MTQYSTQLKDLLTRPPIDIPQVPSYKSIAQLPLPQTIEQRKHTEESSIVPQEPSYTSNIENGLLSQKVYSQYIRHKRIGIALVLLKIVMCFTYFEEDIQGSSQFVGTTLALALAIQASTVILKCISQRASYLALKPSKQISYSPISTVLQMALFSLLYPMPWLNEVYINNNFRDPDGNIHPLPFKLNHLLVILAMLVSGVQLAFLIVMTSVYNNPRAKRTCKIYELEHRELYANKCLFKDMPMFIFTVVFGSTMLFFTFAFRVAEAGVPAYPTVANHFLYYQNCFWYSGITATGTGFGDITVHSDIGKLISFFCSVWGAFNISIIVVLLHNTFSLSHQERQSLITMKKITKTLDKRELSGQYISVSIWRLWLNKKYNLDYQESLSERRLRRKLASLRKDEKLLSTTAPDVAVDMQRQFDSALIDIETVVENNKDILAFVGKEIFMNCEEEAEVVGKGKISDDRIKNNSRSKEAVQRKFRKRVETINRYLKFKVKDYERSREDVSFVDLVSNCNMLQPDHKRIQLKTSFEFYTAK